MTQDACGSIWKVDLSFSLSMQKPSRVHRCHSAPVKALSGSGSSSLLLSGGDDGKTCIYDLNRKVLVNHIQYSCGVTCLRWVPARHDPTGMQVLMGYDDGVVRLYGIESEAEGSGAAVGNIFRITRALSVK